MDKVVIGYDDNLGMPSDFAKTVGCEIRSYHDLGEMIDAFIEEQLTALFIPAGALPYVERYQLISQAFFGPQRECHLQGNFVSNKSITVQDLPSRLLGRVNEFCTISFWAPLLYLMKLLPQNTAITFRDTNGFQDMLQKTMAEKIDACMIWDIFLQPNAAIVSKANTLFIKNDLPTPVIISMNEIDPAVKEKINHFATQDKKAFFTGFQAPNTDVIQSFLKDIKKASAHFQVRTDDVYSNLQ